MSHGSPDRESTFAAVRSALAGGDGSRAGLLVVSALAHAPHDAGLLRLLDEIGDTLERADWDIQSTTASVEEIALCAHMCAREDQLEEAVGMVAGIASSVVDSAFVEWVPVWLSRTSEPRERGLLQHFLGARLAALPGVVVESKRQRRGLARLAPVVKRGLELSRESPDFLVLAAAVHRKLADHETAVELAARAHGLRRDWGTSVALAMAHRAQGAIADALRFYNEALALEPHDVDTRLDVADMLLEHHRLLEAETAYEAVLEREPEHRWAGPSALYIRALIDHDEGARRRLRALATGAEGTNDRARELLQDLETRRTPYVGFIPAPDDALTVAMERALERERLTVELAAAPPPSARLAATLQASALGRRLDDVLTLEHPGYAPTAFDDAGGFPLWLLTPDGPRPILPAPLPRVSALVAELACAPTNVTGLWRLAGRGATRLDDEEREQLLAVMTTPPPPMFGRPAASWVLRVQIATAFTIAQLDGPWPGSFRRDVLLSLARGPEDWTVCAALVALARLANHEPDTADEVAEVFRERLRHAPGERPVCYHEALVSNALFLPNLSDDERRRLRAQKRALDGR